MDVHDLLDESLGRVPETVRDAVEGLDAEALRWRPAPDANPIGWLVWHLTREQDAQVAPLAGVEELWTRDGWADRFTLPEGANDHGYGWTSEQVAGFVAPSAEVLLDHLDAVTSRCRELLGGLDAGEFDRVLDDSYDPPVTVGVRVVSIVDDAVQHAGQVAYVRGLLDAAPR
jgi:hypothetical protein